MTKEQVIAMAKQAGFDLMAESPKLVKFAAMVRNAAMEEAAQEFRGLYPLAGDQVANTLLLMKEPTERKPVCTTGHCKEKAKAGGCQLHNLQCGYPACDRKLT